MIQCRKTNRPYTLIGVVLLIVLINWYTVILLKYNPKPISDATEIIPRTSSRAVKYILQWTLPDTEPFVWWGKGQEEFLKRKCKVTECFVTNNKALLKKITDYDAIAFHGPEITWYKPGPRERSERQKYVYVSMESSHYYPICDKRYDDFFNWTWTYRLDSDVPYAYISIRDVDGNVIGPHEAMNWINMDSMKPISEELKERLRNKKKAAAWFVSNCQSKSKRESYVKKLQQELEKYHLEIDIFGKCGPKSCSLSKKEDCLKMIEEDYYFYMSMENSFSEDYVTEKLLTALQNFAVPVVYGAANYTRFMPDGIYLNAGEMAPAVMAKEMNDIIQDKDRYYSFFKWRNHYSYHSPEESPETDWLCRLCDMLHNDTLMAQTTTYPHFRQWWNRKECNSAHMKKSNAWLQLFGLIAFGYIQAFLHS